VLIWAVVRAFVYPAPKAPVAAVPAPPLEAVVVRDGAVRVMGWWLAPPRAESPTVLVLHGNGDDLSTVVGAGVFRRFGELGFGVLAIDYPGYGRSDGVPGEAANIELSQQAWWWLRERSHGPRWILGWSLGAAIATQLAAADPEGVDVVVLISAWDRLASVAGRGVADEVLAEVLPETYDSAAAAPAIAARVLMVHGMADEAVLPAHARRLFDRIGSPKQFVEIEGAGHGDPITRPETWQAIAALAAVGSGGSGGQQAVEAPGDGGDRKAVAGEPPAALDPELGGEPEAAGEAEDPQHLVR
jgi:pimeloyl-ACP methyl ester carboxylesterase